MAVIPGSVLVTGFVAPSDSTDTYPSHDALYGMDGYRSVANNTERDAIPAARRRFGMQVFTQDSLKVWRLESNLTTWTDVSSSVSWSLDGNTNGALKTIGTLDNYDLPIITNGLERMRIGSTGNVGVGRTATTFFDIHKDQNGNTVTNTSNPNAGVVAAATYRLSDGTRAVSMEMFGVNFTTANYKFAAGGSLSSTGDGGLSIVAASASGDIRFYSGGTSVKGYLLANGKFGIGISPVAYGHFVGTTEQVRIGYDVSNYYSTTVSSTGNVVFNAVGAGAGFEFSDRVGVNTAISSNSILNITSVSGDAYGGFITATNLTNNGIGFSVTSSSPVDTSNVGVEGISSCAYVGSGTTASYGVRGKSIVSGYSNAGVFGEGRNGVLASYGVYGIINSGASVVPSAGTRAVYGQNTSSNGSSNSAITGYNNSTSAGSTAYGLFGWCDISSGVTNAIAGYFKANGATNNYAIVTDGGNVGIGTLTPSSQAIMELSSTTQALLLMRMTATQASAITPANGMLLYVTNTNGTFTSVGFWGHVAGNWEKLNN